MEYAIAGKKQSAPALPQVKVQQLFRFLRSFCPALAAVCLAGCVSLGLSHENDGGHKGRVVDAFTGQALVKARIRGALPSYDRSVRTKEDGSFCYHLKGDPGGIVISAKGYAPLRISVAQFLRANRFELKPATSQPSRIWNKGDEKNDFLTPLERKFLKRN